MTCPGQAVVAPTRRRQRPSPPGAREEGRESRRRRLRRWPVAREQSGPEDGARGGDLAVGASSVRVCDQPQLTMPRCRLDAVPLQVDAAVGLG
jgi:hypothetical protein